MQACKAALMYVHLTRRLIRSDGSCRNFDREGGQINLARLGRSDSYAVSGPENGITRGGLYPRA